MNSRTILIGDLHGCYDEAIDLLDAVAATSSDRVIFLGDLVDRGPQPRECVELAMKHECILGNHEEKHLQIRKKDEKGLVPDHVRTRRALSDEHYEYFASLPTYIQLPEFGAAAIHAGAMPNMPVPAQDPYHLLHAQCINPPERKSYWPSKAPPTHTFWTNHWKGPERLIFGHSVVDRPLITEHAVGIDTGCVFGLPLTALVLPDWQIVQVPSRQPRSKERRVAAIAIHDNVHVFS
jgi:serine/threonine protein phosphatase 1